MTLSVEHHINCDDLLKKEGKIKDKQKNSVFFISDQENSKNIARIFNIQRYSLNDGSGIRTVIFFKGCPHHCPWCSNPESISRKIQLVRRKLKCIKCNVCSYNSEECPSGALEKIGYDIHIDELMKLILKDDIFFRTSGGGVTLSGGEVLLQAKFVSILLTRLKKIGINTAIETAGDSNFENFLSVASRCDQVLFDFKIMDEQHAKEILNIRLSRVLDNFKKLYNSGVNLVPRLPLIPKYTMTVDNVLKILTFLKEFDQINEIHILPFHKYGEPKYKLIGQVYKMKAINPPTNEDIMAIKHLIESYGYKVVEGG